jgi:hypothetical protein
MVDSACNDIDSETPSRSLFVFGHHVGARFPHRFDHLIKAHVMDAIVVHVQMRINPRLVSSSGRGVAFDSLSCDGISPAFQKNATQVQSDTALGVLPTRPSELTALAAFAYYP